MTFKDSHVSCESTESESAKLKPVLLVSGMYVLRGRGRGKGEGVTLQATNCPLSPIYQPSDPKAKLYENFDPQERNE